MLKDIEVSISSNWLNALNFVIFDILLISLVYYLTADVMGRLNDSTLRDGEPRRLFIASPPVLGGGLCTTHRSRAVLLLFARFLGLGLILLTNLTIKGEERRQVYKDMDTIMTSGNISRFTKAQYEAAIFVRAGCQGSRPADPAKNEGNGTFVFYGELRGEKFDDCVTNRSLMSAPPIEFDSQILLRNMNISDAGEVCDSRRRTMRNRTVAEYFCSRGIISCVIKKGEDLPDINSCRGLVRHENETYITEEGAAYPEMDFEPTHARLVRGLDLRNPYWLDGIFISTALMKDTIDVTFAAGRERRLVMKEREVQWTLVNPLWLAALAFKAALVAALAFTAFSLKRAGFRTVAHDEQRLAEMLRTGLEENVPPGRRRSEEGETGIFLNAAESVDGLLVYADSHPRRPPSASTVLQGGEGKRRNTELHRAEEMYF